MDKFINGGDIIYVYPDRKLVFYNGEMFDMKDVAVYNREKGKFSFGDYQVKVLVNRMTLFDSKTKTVYKIFMREDQGNDSVGGGNSGGSSSNSGTRVFLLTQNKRVKIINYLHIETHDDQGNIQTYSIVNSYKRGLSDVYITSFGDMVISNLEGRPSSWKGIPVQEVKD
jgi:hypothetical protein